MTRTFGGHFVAPYGRQVVEIRIVAEHARRQRIDESLLQRARPRGFAQAQRREDGQVERGVAARAPEEFVGDEVGFADAERQRQHHALAHAPQRLFHDFSDVIKHLRHGATLACSFIRVNANDFANDLKTRARSHVAHAAHRLRISRALSFACTAARETRARRSAGTHEDRHQPHDACRPARNRRCATGTRTRTNSSSCCRRSGGAAPMPASRCSSAGMCAGFPLPPMARPATDIS